MKKVDVGDMPITETKELIDRLAKKAQTKKSKQTFVADYNEYKRRMEEFLPEAFGADVKLTSLKLDYQDVDEWILSMVDDPIAKPKCYVTITAEIDLSD